MAPDGKHQEIDWENIEADYRAGIKSLRQIGAEHGLSHVAVDKRAKKEAWPRDLSAKIKAKAAALVNKGAVNGGLTKATESEVVTSNAELQASIQIAHRKDIPLKRALVAKLFAEVESQTDNGNLIADLKKALVKNDMTALSNIAIKMSSLPSRIKGVSELVTAYKSLIGLERQAFGISDESDIEKGVIVEVVRYSAKDTSAK